MIERKTLEYLALQKISVMIFEAWNFSTINIAPQIIGNLSMHCQHYLDLPPQITFDIADHMAFHLGPLSLGHAIWLLQANSTILKSIWFDHLNLKELCSYFNENVKRNVLELQVDCLFPMKSIENSIEFVNLKVLEIFYDVNLKNCQVEMIMSHCPRLEILRLPGCKNVDSHAFAKLWQLHATQQNLRSLDISYTSVSAARAVTLLEQLVQLEEFCYHNVSSFLRYQHRSPKFGKKLKKLKLGDSEAEDLFNLLPSEDFVPAAQDFRVLKELVLCLPPSCVPKVLRKLCRDCDNLETLRLSFEHSLFDEDYEMDGEIMFDFNDLGLALCPSSTWTKNPYKLTNLELAWVSDVDLNVLFLLFSHVKNLFFVNCTIKSHTNIQTRQVKSLHLSHMTSRDVNRVLRSSTNFEVLKMYEVPLSEHTFRGIQLNQLSNLKKVSVDYSTGYAMSDVEELKSMVLL